MTDELLYLHLKAKYIVVINKEKNGCSITYPANVLIQPNIELHTDTFTFIDNKLIVGSSLDKDKEKEVEIFGYDNRFLVMTSLAIKIDRYKINKNLVVAFDGLKKKRGLLSILPEPKGELKIKEDFIKNNYSQILERLFYPPDAEKAGILDGFNNITNLIIKGEF
jgi:hypothetical protein